MTANPQYFDISSFQTNLQFPFTQSSQAEFPQLNLAKTYSFSSSPSNNSFQTLSSPQHPLTSQFTSETFANVPKPFNNSFLEDISDSFFDIHHQSSEEPLSSPSILEQDHSDPRHSQYDEMIKDFVLSGINNSSKTIVKTPLSYEKSSTSQKKKRQTWKAEEDSLVLELIEKHGQKWNIISKMMSSNRNGKQIRDRYLNVLTPNIKKSRWTEQEDALVLSLYEKWGSKWRQIAEELPGRTEAQVKNRFHTYLRGSCVKKQEAGKNMGNLDGREGEKSMRKEKESLGKKKKI